MDDALERGLLNVANSGERVEQKHESIFHSLEYLDNSIDSLERLIGKIQGAENNVKELPDSTPASIPTLANVLAETSATILERRDRIDDLVARLNALLF